MQVVKGNIRPLKNDILVRDMEAGYEIRNSGLIIPDDSRLKDDYIKPRWAKVWKVGQNVKDVLPGQWVLIEHGRWSRRLKVINDEGEFFVQKIDPEAILLVSDDYKPSPRTEYWIELPNKSAC